MPINRFRNLKWAHAQASDDQEHILERMMPLFAEDLVLDYEHFGRYEGKEALRELVETRPFSWTIHYMIPQSVEVSPDGRTARDICYLWEPALRRNARTGAEEAVWIGGVYQDQFVKEDGRWKLKQMKLKQMKLKLELLSPYAEGWAKTRRQ
jgi:SnoaL-like domain